MLEMLPSKATIFALSSGSLAQAGVAVIRISGSLAKQALQALITSPPAAVKKQGGIPDPRRAVVRKLYDPNSHEILDESLILWMPAPKSFTGEDTAELHTHGSRAVIKGVLEALGNMRGLRPAERGEFTQRAYENGRMDLTEVEGLADLIAADTSLQRKQALQQMGGSLKVKYELWREEIKKCLAHTEAVIDFGDDDESVEDSTYIKLRPMISKLIVDMKAHLMDNRRGEIIRNGLFMAIAGPPNAGKSSLLNLLARRPAAIVSPIAGTTRDVVQVQLDISGLPVIISDTAGLRSAEKAADDVEREGIRRAREAVENSQITLFVWDSSDKTEGLNALNDLISSMNPKQRENIILVANKSDLSSSSVDVKLGSMLDENHIWKISCRSSEGIEEFLEYLETELGNQFETHESNQGDSGLITRERHRYHVQACVSLLERSLIPNLPMDLAAEEIRYASAELGRITGAVGVEELLDVIFRDFCIGK